MNRKPTVRWVTGRRGALARAVACDVLCPLLGVRFSDLPLRDQSRMQGEVDEKIGAMISNGVLAEFLHEYRE